MRQAANYNNIAPVYDLLVKLVFGNKLDRASSSYMADIQPNSKILIVGVGTGKALELLAKSHAVYRVDVVDTSAKMLERAKTRDIGSLDLHIYHEPISKYKGSNYDVILLNFFLDQFSNAEGIKILSDLRLKLKPQGIVLFCDFIETDHWLDRLLLSSMKLFFLVCTGLRIKKLPDYHTIFLSAQFIRLKNLRLYRSIESSVYLPL